MKIFPKPALQIMFSLPSVSVAVFFISVAIGWVCGLPLNERGGHWVPVMFGWVLFTALFSLEYISGNPFKKTIESWGYDLEIND